MPHTSLDPFAFTLRPFAKSVLEDFLLAEMPPLDYMKTDQRAVMTNILASHQEAGECVNRVGLIYARSYLTFQHSDKAHRALPEFSVFACQIMTISFQEEVSTDSVFL